ncbi:MAG: hypothetical protein ACP5KD_09150 [Fervidobacterium sp.]
MNRINSIKTKIEQIESLLAAIKGELDTLSKEDKGKPKKARTEESLPLEEELRGEYEKLYEQFIVGNSKAIEEFIKGKSKSYLKAFCKANSLPVDITKVSKDGIVNEVMQWLAQRKVITKKVT